MVFIMGRNPVANDFSPEYVVVSLGHNPQSIVRVLKDELERSDTHECGHE